MDKTEFDKIIERQELSEDEKNSAYLLMGKTLTEQYKNQTKSDLNLNSNSNIPPGIWNKVCKNLHRQPNHPLCIVKKIIFDFFGEKYQKFEDFLPLVSVTENFDSLLIPQNHPSRNKSDTYYLNKDQVLRTHTTAHQAQLLKCGFDKFLVCGDVYRKDAIDKTHYPVFHQMEGVCLNATVDDLKKTMMQLMSRLFPNYEVQIASDYFPFTHPSFEINIRKSPNDRWLEVAGCGMIRSEILQNCGIDDDKTGWAFGIGLERIAMLLFQIPDIRLFWSDDAKFLDQFRMEVDDGNLPVFKPFSNIEKITKDLSFFIPELKKIDQEWSGQNDFFEICREQCGDLLEQVDVIDKFFSDKKNMISFTYRLFYTPSTSLTDPGQFTHQVNNIHQQIHSILAAKLNVLMR